MVNLEIRFEARVPSTFFLLLLFSFFEITTTASQVSISSPLPPTSTPEWTPSSSISWQIHSYNDLREWPQAFIKGTRWLKIDPNYQNAAFCVNQTNVVQDPRGCFLLVSLILVLSFPFSLSVFLSSSHL
jgi:hypothetical protein